jgi:hypothetical protein
MRLSPLIRWSTRAALGVLIAAVAVAGPADAAGGKSAVVPPNAKTHGLTYGEWSAAFWQWAFSMPVDAHPLFDTAPASEGQSGKVWFLGGTFTTIEETPGVVVGEADRTITVPTGTFLFFPILNVEASDIEGNGETEAELRAAAEFFADFIDPANLFVRIDGKPVSNLAPFRVQSPLIPIAALPEDNILLAPAGTTGIAVGDGYHIMLKPLSVGTHTLEFGGFVDLSEIGGPLFMLDIRYTITVAPARKR